MNGYNAEILVTIDRTLQLPPPTNSISVVGAGGCFCYLARVNKRLVYSIHLNYSDPFILMNDLLTIFY